MADSPTRIPSWPRRLAWCALALAVLLVAGFVAGRAAISAYLRSEGFRDFLAQRAGQALHADVKVAPLHFTGLDFYGDGFQARGQPGASFRELHVEGMRAELSLRRFFERVWQVESLHAERVQLSLDPPPVSGLKEMPLPEPAAPSAGHAGWLPRRVEIARADVSDAQLRWPGGEISGVAVELSPQEGGWRIIGAGGLLAHKGQPPLDVQNLRLFYRPPALFLQNAELRPKSGGSIRVSGDVRFDKDLALRAEFDGIALTPLLSDDWRMRLQGQAVGEVEIRSSLPSHGSPELRGKVRLIDADLTALPVLDQIALFTRTQQFRRLKLTLASADFEQHGSRLEVRNLVAESARLLRIEGRCSIEGGTIDGSFQVGVTASSLQWLPGSQDRVFTQSRDGYLWTTMRLTGPIGKPQDDLSPRLAAAVGEAIIDSAQGTVKDAIKTGQDVLKGALDLLLSPPK